MIGRAVLALKLAAPRVWPASVSALLVLIPVTVFAQDIPGIEICTAEKTMERRTSCLQSNIDFLQKTITRLAADHQQKIDAAKAQIEALKTAVISLQKIVDDLQASQKKAEDANKKAQPAQVKDLPAAKDAPPAKDAPAVSKEGPK